MHPYLALALAVGSALGKRPRERLARNMAALEGRR